MATGIPSAPISVVSRSWRSRAVGERVGRALPHLDGDLGHQLDDPPAAGTHVGPEAAHCPLCDVLGQVGTALQLRDDEEQRDEVSQLLAGGPGPLELLPDEQLDRGCQLVDLLVAVDHRLGELWVVVEERRGGMAQRFGDEGKKPPDLEVDGRAARFGGSHASRPYPEFPLCSRNVHQLVTDSSA
jgi:hypothetical protein